MTKLDFANALEESMNYTQTGNGDTACKSSLDANLDLFAKAGGVRGNNGFYSDTVGEVDYQSLFSKALYENSNIALRNLLNIRDFRHSGMGERDLFRELFVELVKVDSDLAVSMIKTGVIQELGRWDDLVAIYASVNSKAVKAQIVETIKGELGHIKSDYQYNSLLPKWLPTNTRNKRRYAVAKELAHALGYVGFREYRKDIVEYRKRLNLIETNLTEKDYDNIDISHIPSRAFKKYQTALFTHKEDAMHQFLDDVEKGKKQVKVTGVTPDEIIKPYVDAINGYKESAVSDTVINAQWQAMKDKVGDVGNTLIMADTSGSMFGFIGDSKPAQVALGLAIMFAETNTGMFKNQFMTFSSKPSLIEIAPTWTLKQKVNKVAEADWQGSTNLDAAFEKVYDVARTNDASQADLPERIVVISDLQFDEAIDNYYYYGEERQNNGEPHLNRWQKKFADIGLKCPDIIYWNVSSYANSPATKNDSGVALISGFTTGTMDAVMKAQEITPLTVMNAALFVPQYDIVDSLVNRY